MNNSIFSKKQASEVAKKMRESAQMARVFEPSESERNDAKRQAWNKTISTLAEKYGVSASAFQPHRDISVYSITSHDYIEGPVFIGAYRFYITIRFNLDFYDDEEIPQIEETVVPHLSNPRKFDCSYSELYDAIAEALEDYSKNGKIHKEAMPVEIDIPNTMPRSKTNGILGLLQKLKRWFAR